MEKVQSYFCDKLSASMSRNFMLRNKLFVVTISDLVLLEIARQKQMLFRVLNWPQSGLPKHVLDYYSYYCF